MQKFKILGFIIKWDSPASPLVKLPSGESGRMKAFMTLTSTSLQGKHQNLTIINWEEMYWKVTGQPLVGLWVGGRLDVSAQVEGSWTSRTSVRIGDSPWPQSCATETTSNMAAVYYTGHHWPHSLRKWAITCLQKSFYSFPFSGSLVAVSRPCPREFGKESIPFSVPGS